MTKPLKLICPITDGKIDVHPRKRIAEYIETCGLDAVEITVDAFKKTRSVKQNRYYWGVIVDTFRTILEDAGQSMHPSGVHEALAAEVGMLKKIAFGFDGQPIVYTQSTTDLTTVEFENYMEKCRAFAAEQYGLVIPLPNEAPFEDERAAVQDKQEDAPYKPHTFVFEARS